MPYWNHSISFPSPFINHLFFVWICYPYFHVMISFLSFIVICWQIHVFLTRILMSTSSKVIISTWSPFSFFIIHARVNQHASLIMRDAFMSLILCWWSLKVFCRAFIIALLFGRTAWLRSFCPHLIIHSAILSLFSAFYFIHFSLL